MNLEELSRLAPHFLSVFVAYYATKRRFAGNAKTWYNQPSIARKKFSQKTQIELYEETAVRHIFGVAR